MSATLQQLVRAAIAPAVAGNVWYGQNMAVAPTYPYATFLFVSSTSNISFDGPSDLQSSRVQVDVFDRDTGNARALAAQIAALMQVAFVVGSIDTQDFPPDPDTKVYRCMTDFGIWSTVA